jgi:hypothetical protein
MNFHVRKLGRTATSGLAVVAATLAGLFSPAPAHAWYGWGAQGNCERVEFSTGVRHYIQVTAPTLNVYGNWSSAIINGVFISPLNQWVEYRAHLYRLESYGWRKLESSPVYGQWRTSGSSESNAWWRWSGGYVGWWAGPIRGDHSFEIGKYGLRNQAYAVSVEYWWRAFADGSGADYQREYFVPLIDDRKGAYYLSQVDRCYY